MKTAILDLLRNSGSVGLRALLMGLLLLLASCSPHSQREFQKEAEALCDDLIRQLQKVETRDELLAQEGELKKKFKSLVILMIEARAAQEDDPQEWDVENKHSSQLKAELRRIYELEGGRMIIERAEQEALVKLDAYERALIKKREKVSPSFR